jgi:hypothetical protein
MSSRKLRLRSDLMLAGIHLLGGVAGELARLEGPDDAGIDLVDYAPLAVEAVDDVAGFSGV